MSKTNPIIDAVDVNDFGAWNLSAIIAQARANPEADAYDGDSRWVFLATKQPTQRDIRAWKKKLFGDDE